MVGKHPEDKVRQIEKVVMYSRIGYSSGAEEDEIKFSLQENAMHKFCKENNLEVKCSFREVAAGTLDLWSRPVLDAAIDQLKWSRKEKSVLLVSRIDRLSKDFSLIVKLLNNYNPKFLAVSTGMRYDQFIFTLQTATAEEEFRFKYGGKLYTTSDEGYQKFANIHKEGIEMLVRSGHTYEQIVEMYENLRMPIPSAWEWSIETIQKIVEMGE